MRRVGDLGLPSGTSKTSTRGLLGASALALAMALSSSATSAEGVTMDDLAQDAQSTSNVLMNGLG